MNVLDKSQTPGPRGTRATQRRAVLAERTTRFAKRAVGEMKLQTFLIHPFPGTEPAETKFLTVRDLIRPSRTTPLRIKTVPMVTVRRTHSGIPTGFCPKAQGCPEGATLGQDSPNLPNRNAVVAILFLTHAVGQNPVGVISSRNLHPR